MFTFTINEMEKIILCDVQIEIYPDLEKSLLDLLHNSGYPEIKFEKNKSYLSTGTLAKHY